MKQFDRTKFVSVGQKKTAIWQFEQISKNVYFESCWSVDLLKVGSINSIFYFLHKAAEPFNCLEQDNLA